MARLVPAKCPNCGASLRLDPALELVTCEYCGTSSFIQTKQRPPTERVLETRQPVIRVSESPAPVSGLVLALIVVGVLALIGALAYAKQRRAEDEASSASAKPAAPALSTASAAPKPSPTFFEEAKHIRWIFEQRFGSPVRLHELTIYDRSLVAQVQDAKQPKHVDRYQWSHGVFDPPTPVGINRAEVARKLFDLAELDFALIPRMVDDALRTAAIEDGKVSHISVRRPLPFRKQVAWHVYVKGERQAESYEYSLQGKRLK